MRSIFGNVEHGTLARIGACHFGLDIVALLAGIGTAVTAGAAPAGSTAAAIVGGATVASGAASLAGTGLSIAQATKEAPKVTTPADRAAKQQEEARRRGILAKQSGRQSTITTGVGGVGSGSLGKSSLGTGVG